MCPKVAGEPGGRPGPRARRRLGRCLTYWAGGAILVAVLSSLLTAAEVTDFHHDRGPLSLPSSVAVARPYSPGSTRILSRCFGRFPRGFPYRVASVVIDGSPVYACYQFTGYGGLTTHVVNARGVTVQNVQLLERYGAWKWVDPYPPFGRVLTAALAAGFVLLRFLYARVPRVRFPYRLGLLAVVPVFGVGAVSAPGLRKELRRRLFLLHLLPYLVFGGILIVAFGGLAPPVTPLNALCSLLPFGVGLYALLAGRFLLAGDPADAAAPGMLPARPAAGPQAQPGSPATTAAPARPTNHIWTGDISYADLSREAAAVRQLHYLALTIKCSAVLIGVAPLGDSGSQTGLAQILSAVLLFTGVNAVAFLLEDSKITPLAAVAGPVIIFMTSLVVYAAISRPSLVGFLQDAAAVVLWLPVVLMYLVYRRSARRSGALDRDIQAALCAGHLQPPWRTVPPRPRRLPLMFLPRLAFGLVGAAIALVLSILNTVLGIPVIGAAIQFLLDFLFTGSRKLMHVSGSSPDAAGEPVIAYTESTDPEQWSISVRGDIYRFGKLLTQKVPFEDFLLQRLSVYGRPTGLGMTPAASTAAEAAASVARLVVIAVGAPIPGPEINAAVKLMAGRPWLLVFYPADGRQVQRLRLCGITPPAGIEWTGVLGLLHVPPDRVTVLRAGSKRQWPYLVVVRHAAAAAGLLQSSGTRVSRPSAPEDPARGQAPGLRRPLPFRVEQLLPPQERDRLVSSQQGAHRMDIATNVSRFMGERTADQRYASFDYCFNYFQSFRDGGNIGDIATSDNMQLSCLHLGFYLASWGMFRASSNLPRWSLKQFEPVVRLIAHTPDDLWGVDAHCYSEAVCRELVNAASEVREALRHPGDSLPTVTAATKIMLGVFGNVPAFDSRVVAGLRKNGLTGRFGLRALRDIGRFYEGHREEIERYREPTLDFTTSGRTQRCYTRAKVIDEIFFIEGGGSVSAL